MCRSRRPRWRPLAFALWLGAAAAGADPMFVSSDFIGTATLYRFDLPSNVPVSIATSLTFIEGGACSPSGLVYFAGGVGNWVTRWAQDGSAMTSIVPAAGQLESPEGLSFDAAGNLYLNQRDTPSGVGSGIWRLDGGDPANTITRVQAPYSVFGEGTTIVRGGPHAGALLFVDSTGRRVFRAEPPTAPGTVLIDSSAMSAVDYPFGVTTNSAGEIFLAIGSLVRRFDPEGVFLDDYVTGAGQAGYLEFDSTGDLYFTDLDLDAVWRVRPDRTRTLFATVTAPIGLTICRCANCSLAVRFDSWAASARRDGSVEVRFTTLSEDDTIGFLVERAAAADGPFTPAGAAVAAHGPRQAYVVHPVAGDGRSWYRIVELTSDGRGSMSPAFRAAAAPADPPGRRRRR